MATKSILKNIDIKDKKMGSAIVYALEGSKRKKNKNITISRTYEEIKGEKVKDFFEED